MNNQTNYQPTSHRKLMQLLATYEKTKTLPKLSGIDPLEQSAIEFLLVAAAALRAVNINFNVDMSLARRAPRYMSIPIRVAAANDRELGRALDLGSYMQHEAGVKSVIAQRDWGIGKGILRYDFQLPKDHWINYDRSTVNGTEIGIALGPKKIGFKFSENTHYLFAGTTGAGKSTAIKSALVGISEAYTPDQVEIYLADPHRDFAAFENMAHLGAPIAHEKEEIAAMIEHVNAIYRQRRANGQNNDGRKWIIFVMDECQEVPALGNKEEGLNMHEIGLVAALAHGARKYKMRLLLGSQEPLKRDMPGIVQYMNGRFAGYVQNKQSSNLITGRTSIRCNDLALGGDFFKVTPLDIVRFQVAMPRQSDYDRLPRAEIAPLPDIERSQISVPDGTRAVGRPASELNPQVVAKMIFLSRQRWREEQMLIGRKRAASKLGIGRDLHGRYKNFILEMLKELRQLIKEERNAK